MAEKQFKLYTSSAGSGKTFTLALSYIRLVVKNPAAYKSILAVTFTNKATQEMKSRILQYLYQLSRGEGGAVLGVLKAETGMAEEKIRANAALALANILHTYPYFSVATIDSFFQRVVQSFAKELGLQGGFEIELDQEKVLNDLVDRIMADVGANKPLTEWLIRFSETRVDEGKSWDIRREIKNLAWEIFNEGFKKFESEIRSHKTAIQDLLDKNTAIATAFESRMAANGAKVLKLLERYGLAIDDFAYGYNSAIGYFEKLSRGVVSLPGKRVETAARNPESLCKKGSDANAAIMEACENGLHEAIVNTMNLIDEEYEVYATAIAINRYIYTLGILSDISLKLHDFREENQALLISDLPDFLRRIINENDAPFIYEKTGSRYRHFLIDEFQDTSGFQWDNFKPLITNSLAEGNFNLAVGDVKQSIYRWRGGNWELLLRQIRDDVGEALIDFLDLDANRRSKKTLIRFFNALFAQAPQLLGLSLYDAMETTDASLQADIRNEIAKIGEAYRQAMQRIPEETLRNDAEGRVRIRFYEDSEDSPWSEQALQALPGMIEELQDEGYALSDIAVLVRTREEGEAAVECLMTYKASEKARSDCRYEAISSESLFLTAAHSVRILLNALAYLNNRQNEVALLNLVYEWQKFILKNDGVPVEDLLTLGKNEDFIREKDLLPGAFFAECALLQILPVYETAERLIRMFRLQRLTGEMAYLQAFLDLIIEYAMKDRGEIGGFLDWWQTTGVNRSIEMPEEVDAVRILTIHKSKGLQFKATIVPFCNWSLDHNTFFDNILWCKNPRPPFDQLTYLPVRYAKALEDTLFSQDYYTEKIKAAIDNLNLLYVAFTRAEDQLLVSGRKPSAPQAGAVKNVSDLLYQALAAGRRLDTGAYETLDLTRFWNETAGVFDAGRPGHTPGKPAYAAEKLEQFISTDWREKISVKLSAKDISGGDGFSGESLKHGRLMHQILARTATAQDLAKILKEYHYAGTITRDEARDLEKKLTALLSLDGVREWFSGRYRLRTEISALLPGGGVRRLDRVMFREDGGAIVVDFKTGEKNAGNKRQIEEYGQLLNDMGYKTVEGYLLYLDLMEVEKVF